MADKVMDALYGLMHAVVETACSEVVSLENRLREEKRDADAAAQAVS